MKLLISTLLSILGLLLFVSSVSAAIRCETQYGGGQVCVRTGNLQVNKQVKESGGKGGSLEWRDNLGPQQSFRFRPGDVVEYRIQVKNVGDAKFDSVTVVDTLPSQLELTEGNLTQELKNLEVGQTQEVFVKAKVKNADQLGVMNVNCDVWNRAEAKSGDQYDKDDVQVCVEKQAEQAKVLPKAGPTDMFLTLGLSFIASCTGFFILKRSEVRT